MASGKISLPKAQLIYSDTLTINECVFNIKANPYAVSVEAYNGNTSTMAKRQNWTEIGTIPSEIRPRGTVILKYYTPDTNVLFCTLQVLTDGRVRIQTPEITTPSWFQSYGVYAL